MASDARGGPPGSVAASVKAPPQGQHSGSRAEATHGMVLAGRYTLVKPLARGGMATVWVGEDSMLARRVAVKIPHAELADDAVSRERFRREAVAAARLSHPNIVATYDTGTDGDLAYIVMELVKGRNLREVLNVGPIPPYTAIEIATQMADALEAAHRAGLIHRDIKPANVLLIQEGPQLQVKVTDFGVARAMGLLASEEDLTREGMVMGTAKYLAPEQVSGTGLDARTDCYALGVVLYEMLAGEPPFARQTDVATASAHLHEPPPPLSRQAGPLPTGLEDLVMRVLSKKPDDRPPSAAELSRELRALVPDRTGGIVRSLSGGGSNDGHLLPHRTGPGIERELVLNSPSDSETKASNNSEAAGLVRDLGSKSEDNQASNSDSAGQDDGPKPAYAPSAKASGPSRPGRHIRPITPAPRNTKRFGIAKASALLGAAGHGNRGQSLPKVPPPTDVMEPPSPGPVDMALDDPATARPISTNAHRSRSGRAGRGRSRTPVVVAGILALGVIIALVVLAGTSNPRPSPTTTPAPARKSLPIKAVLPYDPQGDQAENDDQLSRVIDGQESSAWSTETYRAAKFGGMQNKQGVGFVLDLGSQQTINTVQLTSPTQGWAVQVFTGANFPERFEGWGKPSTSALNLNGDAVLALRPPAKARYVLVWIVDTGRTDGKYRTSINEVRVN